MKTGSLRTFEQRGFYSGSYKIELTDYEGLDFSRRCFVFPGQSSAYAGMFRAELGVVPALTARFEKADALCEKYGLPAVSRFVLTPETLSNTELYEVRNPALFTLEVALAEAMIEKGIAPAIVTGHSFGEYASFVLAGIAKFEDVFDIVVARDRFSPAARTLGTMIVASATTEDIGQCLTEGHYFVSNINSPKQLVISVRPEHERETLSALKKARIAAKALTEMGQPYHSPMMEGVSLKLAAYVQEKAFTFSAPKVPMISSVTTEVLDASNFESLGGAAHVRDLIARQSLAPVHFQKQIEASVMKGVLNFLEVGPGESCSQFVTDCLEGKVFKTNKVARILEGNEKSRARKTKQISKENSGVLSVLSKVIASVTGYHVDEISVQDNFQEDLGIDSIRKAEIVFKFMESMKDPSDLSAISHINLSEIKRIEDVIEHFERSEAMAATKREAPARFERYVEDWENTPITDFERLATPDVVFGERLTIELGTNLRENLGRLEKLGPNSTLTFLARRENATDLAQPETAFKSRLEPLIFALRAIHQRNERWSTRIALVTEDGCHPYSAALDGFLKSWLREEGFEAYRSISIDILSTVTNLEELVRENFLDMRFNEIRYEKGQRLAKRWVARAPGLPRQMPEQPVIVSLGGGRGIGAAILESFCEIYPKSHVYILGRSSADEPAIAKNLEKLKSLCSHVVYVQADATKPESLRETFSVVASEHGTIDVVFNGVGKEVSRSLKTKTDQDVWEELASKVVPSTELWQLAKQHPVRRIVNYSSIAASFGNIGQTIYALANQIMAGLDRHYDLEKTQVTTLVLPPWDNLGMTENEIILKSLKSRRIALLPKEQGTRLVVDEILCGDSHQAAFLDTNDVRAYDRDITDRQAHATIFASPISTGYPLPMPRLNLRDSSYLMDHVINGNIIYPASSALATMVYAAYHYHQGANVIEGFDARSFVAPDAEKSDVGLEIERLGTDRIQMKMLSPRAVHFQCEAVRRKEPPTGVPAREFVKDLQINPQPLYFTEAVLFNKHYQLATELWFDKDKNILQITRASELTRYTPLATYDRLQQWFEATLQALGGKLLWQTSHCWVPTRIRSITMRFDRGISDALQHRIQISRIDKDRSYADAFVLNSKGEVVIEMLGIEDVPVSKNAVPNKFHVKKVDLDEWSMVDRREMNAP